MSNVSRFVGNSRLGLPTALLSRCAPATIWASFATAAAEDSAANQPSTSGQTAALNSKQLGDATVGAYYTLHQPLVPEAGRQLAGAFYSPREAGHERRGGCKALQQEMAATGTPAVMYRPVMHALFGAVGARGQGGGQQRLLLSGPAGAGKSIALVSLVEWARQNGWLVLYVPSCSALVQGGYFGRRGSSNRWDTLTSAQQLLKGMMDAHGPLLKKLPVLGPATGSPAAPGSGASSSSPSAAAPTAAATAGTAGVVREEARGRSLHDLVVGGLASEDNAELAVDSVLELVRQMAATSAAGDRAPPVLFALDDYNSLYGASDYGWYSPREDPRQARRRPIHSDDLVLASGLRLMDSDPQQLGRAIVVAANTTALPLPAPATPQLQMPYTELLVPGFSEAETRNALAHYHSTGYASSLASSRQCRQLHALTQGNARELRINASTLGLQLS